MVGAKTSKLSAICPLPDTHSISIGALVKESSLLAPERISTMQALRRCTGSAVHAATRRHGYATASAAYAGAAEALRINSDTKVIYQGFTGKQGTQVTVETPDIMHLLIICQVSCTTSHRLWYSCSSSATLTWSSLCCRHKGCRRDQSKKGWRETSGPTGLCQCQ